MLNYLLSELSQSWFAPVLGRRCWAGGIELSLPEQESSLLRKYRVNWPFYSRQNKCDHTTCFLNESTYHCHIRQLLINNTKILVKSKTKNRLIILEAIVIEHNKSTLNKNNYNFRVWILNAYLKKKKQTKKEDIYTSHIEFYFFNRHICNPKYF